MMFENCNSSGVILFLVSIFAVARKNWKFCDALQISKLKTLTAPSTAPKSAVIVDLKLPYSDEELLQRLKNDIILSKVIDGGNKRYYMRVIDKHHAPASSIVSYISELYSKTWNEAVNKKIYDLDCIITCDSLQTHLQYDFSKQPYPIEKVYTTTELESATLSVKEVVYTDEMVKNLSKGFDISQIHFIDSHPLACYDALQQFENVAIGGSFDQLHNGHRKLLFVAAMVCAKRLTVGVTGANMLTAKTLAEYIDPYETRRDAAAQWLGFVNPSLEYNIVAIEDIYGPTITDATLQAIVVSSETLTGAFKINEVRAQQGMLPLVILVINRSDSAILSSTFLRQQKKALLTSSSSSC